MTCLQAELMVEIIETKRQLPSFYVALLGRTDPAQASFVLEWLTIEKRAIDSNERKEWLQKEVAKVMGDNGSGMLMSSKERKEVEVETESLCRLMKMDELSSFIKDCQQKMERFRVKMIKGHEVFTQRELEEMANFTDEEREEFTRKVKATQVRRAETSSAGRKPRMSAEEKDIKSWAAKIYAANQSKGMTMEEATERATKMYSGE
jgi:hypothetical protein